jgi:ABC-type uncharacterized transport system permease subunit
MMNTLLTVFTVLLYLGAMLWQLARWFQAARLPNWPNFLLAWGAISLHAIWLHQVIDIAGGQNLSMFNLLSQLFWAVGILILLISLFHSVLSLGIFVFPMTAASIIFAQLFPEINLIQTGEDLKQLAHIVLAILTVSMLCIAVLQAMLVSFQEWLVRHHSHLLLMDNLPPLQTMEHLLFQLIVTACILLATLLGSSLWFFDGGLNHKFLVKLIFGAIAWIILLNLLLARYRVRISGMLATRWTSLSVLLLIFSYLETRLFT